MGDPRTNPAMMEEARKQGFERQGDEWVDMSKSGFTWSGGQWVPGGSITGQPTTTNTPMYDGITGNYDTDLANMFGALDSTSVPQMGYNTATSGLNATLDGVQAYNSPGIPGHSLYGTDNWNMYEALQSPQSVMRSAFGIPAIGQNPYEKWLLGNAGLMSNVFAAAQMAPSLGVSVPNTFADYLRSSGPSQAYGHASQLYGGMGGLGNDKTRALSEMLGTSGLENLAYGKLASGMAPRVAAYYAGAMPALSQDFNISPDITQGSSFIDWLMQNNPYF